MKVLHIIDSLSLGGAETLVKSLLPRMKDKAIEPEVIILKRSADHSADELEHSAIPVYETGLNNVYSPRQILRLAKFLKVNNYDLVHVHLFPAQYWYVFARLLIKDKYPAVTTEHSSFNKRRNKLLYRLFESYIYKKYEKIICISQAAMRELTSWQPAVADKTVMIYNGIDISKYKKARAYSRKELLPSVKKDSKLILMVASLTAKKDHQTLFKALKVLPSTYELVLVGEGPLKLKYLELVKYSGLVDRVHFLGHRFDVDKIMKTVDLFVHSSHWEGFGLVVVEAMASGLPVIASDVAGLTEVIGNAGMFFPPGDSDRLASLIVEVLESVSLYEVLRKKGLERSKDFDLDLMVSNYIKVYDMILAD
jgi:glycosyltransferase involved in cell wall biosynthesis